MTEPIEVEVRQVLKDLAEAWPSRWIFVDEPAYWEIQHGRGKELIAFWPHNFFPYAVFEVATYAVSAAVEAGCEYIFPLPGDRPAACLAKRSRDGSIRYTTQHPYDFIELQEDEGYPPLSRALAELRACIEAARIDGEEKP